MGKDRLSGKTKPERGSMVFSLLITLVIGILLGGLIYAIWAARSGDGDPSSQEMSRPNWKEPQKAATGIVVVGRQAQENSGIRVGKAALRTMKTTLSATGVVAADQTRTAQLRPLARGLVEKVYVRVGDRVSVNDPLIEYDNIELGLAIGEYLSAQAELDRALTDLDVKRKILERSKLMLEVGATARTTHDIREAEYRDAEAKLNSHRAMVSKVEEQIHRFGLSDEDLQNLRGENAEVVHRTASHSFLRSPFSGVITSYDVAEGELVEPRDQLLTVTDISSVWVQADVYDKDLRHVRLGQPVDVQVAPYPDETFQGTITYISDLIEPETRTVKVRCVVPNPKSKLKLEMFATVEIPIGATTEVLTIPSTAIQEVQRQSVVFVQLSETEFRMKVVQTDVESRGLIEIRSGVTAGELVVTEGSFYLKSVLLRQLIGAEE